MRKSGYVALRAGPRRSRRCNGVLPKTTRPINGTITDDELEVH